MHARTTQPPQLNCCLSDLTPCSQLIATMLSSSSVIQAMASNKQPYTNTYCQPTMQDPPLQTTIC